MASNLKPGWCEAAGKAAGEAERGENLKPTPRRHYVPVLPQPKPEQALSVKRAAKRRKASKQLSRKLDQVLGKVDD
jgi:hypothetical protein